MKIKKLHINNFKSLVNFALEDVKPFCAFVGPNASGKSNIFEALEFTNYVILNGNYNRSNRISLSYFGGNTILSYNPQRITNIGGIEDPSLKDSDITFYYEFADSTSINFYAALSQADGSNPHIVPIGRHPDPRYTYRPDIFDLYDKKYRERFIGELNDSGAEYENDYEQFIDNFSRIFVGKSSLLKFPSDPGKLNIDGSNLPQIVGQIFQNEAKQGDFIEWLRIFIPEFVNIDVKKSNIDENIEFFLYEKSSRKPFPKSLISDGTYNLIALMAAVYQSNQPQFLCIEEPENGLHPQAIELLVDFFRQKCEEEGHHIWLNTHSQTLVRCLEIDEIILVNKIDGITKAKQLTKDDEVDIRTDEAWLSNALGGGVLWSK